MNENDIDRVLEAIDARAAAYRKLEARATDYTTAALRASTAEGYEASARILRTAIALREAEGISD